MVKIDGGCHCGNITYEADIDPETVGICHCTDCQALSGSAFRMIGMAPAESFKLLSGELKTYIKIGDSGAERPQMFCPDCGSPIYATGVGEASKNYNIRLGTVRQRAALTPKFQVWTGSAHGWLEDLASVRTMDRK